jgi:hypothetical protein
MRKRSSGESSTTERSRFEKFTIEVVERKALVDAPYNPRHLSDNARARLKKIHAAHGRVAPVVWNRRTGHVVGGHQGLHILDSMEGSHDYRLTVAAVDVELAEEKALNVALNNGEAQGEWDLEALKAVLGEAEVKKLETGFELAELYQLFGGNPEALDGEQAEALGQALSESQAKWKEVHKGLKQRDNPHFYLLVVFPHYEARKAFTDRLRMGDNRYVAPDVLEAAILESRGEAPAETSSSESRPGTRRRRS